MIGKRLKELREKKNMYQKEFAEALGVDQTTVSSWERDRTEPNMGMVYKMAEILDVTVGELMGEKPSTPDMVAISKGDQAFLNMMHQLDDADRAEILNRIFEMLNRR